MVSAQVNSGMSHNNKSSIKPILSLDYDVIVFSHLRWEFVTQRPQHIIGRLSVGRKVLFVEEPIGYDESNKGTVHTIKPSDNITVIQPRIDWSSLIKELTPIVKDHIRHLNIKNPILWFYAPAFVDMIDQIDHSLVVFDCMDELKAFKGAPPSLVKQEARLMKGADVVFTGGKSLYDAKKVFNHNTHCFPSSVDRAHFEKALENNTQIPEDMTSLPKPVVGFYGVIDERLDLGLIDEVANRMPDVSFVMIGPVVKINPADLPKRDNLHFLGERKYPELPKYLKGIDVAMMPFALNDATKFISPTKTLEFMAAKKPIVSTPIYDVVRDYQREVKISKTAEEFVEAVREYINETNEAKQTRESLQREVIDKTSWDNTAHKMQEIMAKTLERKAAAGAHYPS